VPYQTAAPPLPFPNTKIMNPIEAFKDLPADVEGVAEFSRQIIDSLNNGDIEPLKFKVFLKGIEKTIEKIRETLDPLALEEAEKFGQKSFSYSGAKIDLRETGVKYLFDKCNHPKWASIEKEKKEIESFLKGIKSPTTLVDETTGEVVKVYPPAKKSTSSIIITL
jgi:hypothetical protein